MKKISALLYVVISIIAIIYSYQGIGSNPYVPIAVSVCVEMAVYLYVNKVVKATLFNFSTLFILLIFLFHFGQLLLIAFFSDMITLFSFRIVVDYFSDIQACYALRLMNIAFVSISLGTLLPSSSYRPKFNALQKVNYMQVAKRILIVTFPFKLIIDLLTVYNSFTMGFEQTSQWLQAVPNFIRAIGNISMVGFGILIVAMSINPQKQKKIFLFVIVYLSMLMLSGWRSENIAYFVTFAYLFLSTRPRLKWKNILTYAVVGYFMLCFVQVAADMRTSSDRTMDGYTDMMSNMLFGGGLLIFDALRELGNTGYTAECVLVNWLSNFDPSWGKSYILGLFAIFPNLTGLAGKLTEEAAFASQLQEHNMVLTQYYNIGGSVLGEFFFNFGIVGGIVFSFFVGKILGWFSYNADRSLKSGQYVFLIFAVPVMFASLYWVRDTFGHLIRDVVWSILLSLIIINGMNKKRSAS